MNLRAFRNRLVRRMPLDVQHEIVGYAVDDGEPVATSWIRRQEEERARSRVPAFVLRAAMRRLYGDPMRREWAARWLWCL